MAQPRVGSGTAKAWTPDSVASLPPCHGHPAGSDLGRRSAGCLEGLGSRNVRGAQLPVCALQWGFVRATAHQTGTQTCPGEPECTLRPHARPGPPGWRVTTSREGRAPSWGGVMAVSPPKQGKAEQCSNRNEHETPMHKAGSGGPR